MAYSLSFTPEFFVGPYDLDGIEFDKDRPTSVYQALVVMDSEDYLEMSEEVFGVEDIDIETVMSKIEETDTCRNLDSPVEVYIDEEGYYSIYVYDSED